MKVTESMTGRSWKTHTYRRTDSRGGGVRYQVFGDPRVVSMYGFRDPIIEVNLIEDEAGEYMGWLPADNPTRPRLIARENEFRMQFPYGIAQAEASGQGTRVRLRIEEIPA